MKPIYCDVDNVLVGPILDPVTGEPIDLVVRPDAAWFLESISRYGRLTLLSAANMEWIKVVIRRLGGAARFVQNVYTQEDMVGVAIRIEMIKNARGLSERDRLALYAQVPPIFPPGVIFDDFPVGSWMYWMKGLSTGVANLDPKLWIQVERFEAGQEDHQGLRKAFLEFQRRNAAWNARGRIPLDPGLGRRALR